MVEYQINPVSIPSPSTVSQFEQPEASLISPSKGTDSSSDSDLDLGPDFNWRATAAKQRPHKLLLLHGPTSTCDVCMTAQARSYFPTRATLPADCSHCIRTCKVCIGAYLASAINNRPLDEVGCPTCKASWDRSYIESYSTAEVMVRYEIISMLRLVQAMPTFVWCLSLKCDSGQIHQDGDKAPIVTCAACGFKMCFTHQVAWHPELTCTQYEASKTAPGANAELRTRLAREEGETAATLARLTKPCPSCGAKILKDGGCNHMKCMSRLAFAGLEDRPIHLSTSRQPMSPSVLLDLLGRLPHGHQIWQSEARLSLYSLPEGGGIGTAH